MKKRKTVSLVAMLPFLLLMACGADSRIAQGRGLKSQSSALKEDENMPVRSPMLNEILSIGKIIPPGQSQDVGHIVSRYIPIGTSEDEVKKILVGMNHPYIEKDGIIRLGYRGNNPPFVPNPSIIIELYFNQENYLDSINAQFRHLQ